MAAHGTQFEPQVQRSEANALRHLPFRNSVHLSQQEAYELMRRILSGQMSTEEILAILQFLRNKGETIAEIVGFATAIRELGNSVDVDQSEEPLLDTCGTGGDGTNTFNVSTAAAFVVAGAGLRVAKHGNRRISSQCGSADVLEALGVPVDLTRETVAECVNTVGIGFLFAPLMHPAVRYAQEARVLLKGRTAFNFLGPLTNPARARFQLMGAFSVRAAEILAHASARLGIDRAYVVHGSDGLDEITTTGLTTVFQVEEGGVQKGQLGPADFGVAQATLNDLRGGHPEENAQLIRDVLDGERGPRFDVVAVNAAAALLVARHAPDLRSAMAMAIDSIESGAARDKLGQLVSFSADRAQ